MARGTGSLDGGRNCRPRVGDGVCISGGPTWLRCGRVGGLGRVWGGLAAVPVTSSAVTRCVSFCGYLCGIRVGSVRRVDARSDSFPSSAHLDLIAHTTTLYGTTLRGLRDSRSRFGVRGFGLQRLEGAGRAIVPRPSHWCRHWTSASARGVGWKYGPRPSLAAIYAFKAKPPKGLTWLRSAMRFLVAR